MRKSRLWKKLLGAGHLVFEDGDIEAGLDGREVLVFRVRPDHGHRCRCSRCGRRAPRFDSGEGRRRWRAMDAGTMRVYLEAEAPRVACPRHGVVVAAVPWARPGSRFTTTFEDRAAWLCAAMTGTKTAELLRTTWRSVQGIVERVVAELAGKTGRLAGLSRIGIDEISYRKGRRFLMIVVDHDSGRLVWAAEGRSQATVRAFFGHEPGQGHPRPRSGRLAVLHADRLVACSGKDLHHRRVPSQTAPLADLLIGVLRCFLPDHRGPLGLVERVQEL